MADFGFGSTLGTLAIVMSRRHSIHRPAGPSVRRSPWLVFGSIQTTDVPLAFGSIDPCSDRMYQA